MSEKHINFSLYSQQDIDSSRIEIEPGAGIEQSVKSRALGSISFGQPCTTCNLTDQCPGHNGKFKIESPIFKSSFSTAIEFLLKIICPVCCHIRVQEINDLLAEIYDNDNVITQDHRLRFNDIKAKFKSYDKQTKTKCSKEFCNVSSSNIQYKNGVFVFSLPDSKEVISNQKLYSAFESLTDVFCNLLSPSKKGSRPENVFYNGYLSIPSNYCRPPNVYGETVTEPFTSDLNSLVRTPTKKIQRKFDEVDNGKNKGPYATDTKTSLAAMSNGTAKESHLRKNINGKRLPLTARAVIGPGIDLKIGEVDVPSLIMNGLADQIWFNKVTKTFLLKELRKPVHARQFKFNDFIKESPTSNEPFKIITLKENNKVVAPDYGDYFEFPKQEGSYIIFGRQPSLHKCNLQAGRIKKFKNNFSIDGLERTLNINVSTTASFNADFDGDENTLKASQSTTSNIELGLIMNSRCLLKHTLTGTTMFGFVQDQIVGTNLLLQEKEISREKVFHILGEFIYLLESSPIAKQKIFSGKDILTLVLPTHFTLQGVVEDGELLVDNFLTSMVTSNSYTSLFNGVSQTHGTSYALVMIDILKKIVQNYIKYYGISIKFNDILPNPEILSEMKIFTSKIILDINKQITNVIEDVNKGELSLINSFEIEDLKTKNIEILQKKTIDYLTNTIFPKYYDDESNQFKKCFEIGYKLTAKDLVTLFGYVGQQKNKKGMPQMRINGKSSLFGRKNDLSIESTGFISNPLLSGLTFNQCVTAVKYESLPQIVDVTSGTADAGFIGRKISKCTSNLTINYDRFMTSEKLIINPNTNFLKISMEDVSRVKVVLPNPEMTWFKDIRDLFNKKIKSFIVQKFVILEEVDFYLNIFTEVKEHNLTYPGEVSYDAYKDIIAFVENIDARFYFYLNDLSMVLYTLLTYLDPSGVAFDKKVTISKRLVNKLLDKIVSKLKLSLSPGISIGYEIANTIQEIFTQQKLSSFHPTTKSNSKVDSGSGDLFKQLVDLSKRDKEDVTLVQSKDRLSLEIIKNTFEFISLKNICEDIVILEEDAKTNSVLYRADIVLNLIITKRISLVTIFNMFKLYCNRCLIVSEYFLHQQISKDNKRLYIYIQTTLNTSYKNYQKTFDVVKMYFKNSLWDGVHKGKNMNTGLEIERKPTKTLDVNNKIVDGSIFELKFFVERLDDFKFVQTSKLDLIDLPPWLSYDIGGIQAMKNNTIGKTYKLLNSSYLTMAIKQFFDFRFATNKPLKLKTLNDKSQIIKMCNYGARNNFFHISAFNNRDDECLDIYSSLFVSQRPKIGTNFETFMIDPNSYDRLSVKTAIKEEEEDSDDDDIRIISHF